MMRLSNKRNKPGRLAARPLTTRRGTATVELAVCLPLLVLLVFGGIQACDIIYLKHSLTSAAYEGSLELNRSGATNADVEARIQQVLDSHGVESTAIQLLPEGIQVDEISYGTHVQLVVTANTKDNLMLSSFLMTPDTLQAEVTGTR